jgi:hypothetical protein
MLRWIGVGKVTDASTWLWGIFSEVNLPNMGIEKQPKIANLCRR